MRRHPPRPCMHWFWPLLLRSHASKAAAASEAKAKGGSRKIASVRASIIRPEAAPSCAYSTGAGPSREAIRRKSQVTSEIRKTASAVSKPLTFSSAR